MDLRKNSFVLNIIKYACILHVLLNHSCVKKKNQENSVFNTQEIKGNCLYFSIFECYRIKKLMNFRQ